MRGTAENPSAFDPLDDMAPDEPRFVVRGKDPDGPPVLTEWCRLRRNRAMRVFNAIANPSDQDRLLFKSELEQCREAEDLAIAMADWRNAHPEPEGDGRASYNQIERTQEQLAELARGKRLEAILRHVQEARYHACEVRDGLFDMGLIGEDTVAELSDMLGRLQALADEHDPKAEQYRPQPTLALAVAAPTFDPEKPL